MAYPSAPNRRNSLDGYLMRFLHWRMSITYSPTKAGYRNSPVMEISRIGLGGCESEVYIDAALPNMVVYA